MASAFATTTMLYLLALVFGWATEERGNSGYESLVILLFYAYVIAFETVWKSTSELGYLREPPRHRTDAVTGDNVASMA